MADRFDVWRDSPRARAMALAIGLVLVVAACAGSTSSASDAATQPPEASGVPSEASSTEPSAPAAIGPQIGPEPVTIVAWDHHSDPGASARVDAIYAAFMQKYPQVTIQRVGKSADENKKTQKLALSGADSPDLVMTGNGFDGMGPLVQGGLIIPLDKYYDDWGWRSQYSPASLKGLSFTDDGKTFGSGHLYGVSEGMAMMGVYYNQSKLDALGAQYPATIAELEAICDKAVAGGEPCIQLGDLEGWPAINAADIVIDQYERADALMSWFFGDPGVKLGPGYEEAIEKWQTWAQKGYFPDGVAGKAYSQATADFVAGTGVFMFDGTWVGASVAKMGDIAGYKTMPPLEAGGPAATTGSFGNPWVISAQSKHPDVAAALLDFWQSQEGRQISADNSFLPPIVEGLTFPPGSILEQQANVLGAVVAANGLSSFIAENSPTGLNVWGEEFQKLMAGQTTPGEFVAAIEQDHSTFIESK